jgi:DNA-binding transcriptional MerR regulator
MMTPGGKDFSAMTDTKATLQAGEFAKLAGVTVRTLHHYDRLGLLSPGARNAAGYRLYGDNDLARLQHIAALKFLGLPLQRIKSLLAQSPPDLSATLRLKRRLLSDQRSKIDAALLAIESA